MKRIYFALFILIVVSTGLSKVVEAPAFNVIGSGVVAGGAGCTISEQQTTIADYWPPATTDYMAQGILDKGSKTLCDLKVTFDTATEEVCHAELWTTADESGSQIGSDSDNFTVLNTQSGTLCTAGATEYTIPSFVGGWPSVTTGYFIHIYANDGSPNFSWCADTDDTLYGSGALADNLSRAGGVDLNSDGAFKVSYE